MSEATSRVRRSASLMSPALAVTTPLAPVSTPAAGTGTTARASEPRPGVAYVSGDNIAVADRQSDELSRTPREVGGFSLGGDLLAMVEPGKKGIRTLGLDARTGALRFRIAATLLTPTVLHRGKAVAFSGQGNRDPNATSLWLRKGCGHEARLIRFSFGGSPKVPTGISEGSVPDYSFSEAADVVAVAAGDDMVSFGVWPNFGPRHDQATARRAQPTRDAAETGGGGGCP